MVRRLEDDSGANFGFSSANHDLVGSDPQLGSLASDGGPTQTMVLASTSPAIDKIPADTLNCAPGGADQRGQSRPDVGEQSCDIGTYEYQEPLVLVLAVSPTTAQRGHPVTASVTLANRTTSSQTVTGTVTLVYSGKSTTKITLPYTLALAAGQTLAKTVTFTVPPSFPTGTYTVTATAADGDQHRLADRDLDGGGGAATPLLFLQRAAGIARCRRLSLSRIGCGSAFPAPETS